VDPAPNARTGGLSPAYDPQAEAALADQRVVAGFHLVLMQATPRVVVTPALALVCVAVFLFQCARGVSPTEPRVEDLLAWGANFGPYVAVDREYWRLFTCMFLHIGFVHLAFNMWCLVSAGPMIERLFGNAAFAAVYLLSGLGGELASVSFHPMVVGAGASGAIFGIFGGLMGFLLVQHQAIPGAMLRPLRSSATGFIAYNTLFGLTNERIDNAAHLGGLAAGFACGLLLSRRLPVVPGRRGILRRVAAAVGLTAMLVLGMRAAADHLAESPRVRSASHERDRLARSYNDLIRLLDRPSRNYEEAGRELNGLLDRLEKTDRPAPGDEALVTRLLGEVSSDMAALQKATVPDPELKKAFDQFVLCESNLRDALGELRQAVSAAPPTSVPDPQSFVARMEASTKAAERYVALRDKFLKDHDLVTEPQPASGAPPPKQGRGR
jgi:rhomboid protease GluP